MDVRTFTASVTSLVRLRSRKIFVSYRRSDTPAVAQSLYERLGREYGASNIFFDRADIEYGQRWRDEVTRQIRAADVVIALVGPKWLETLRARAKGDDVLRFELATALAEKKQVIPVLVGATTMPYTGQLPEEVRGFTEFQALTMTDDIERATLELLGRVKPGLGLALSWTVVNMLGWIVGLLVLVFALTLSGAMTDRPATTAAGALRLIGCMLAGAVAGACIGVPQGLVLRPWFERARYIAPAYIVLSALAVGIVVASAWTGAERGTAASVLTIILLPVALGMTLWTVVGRQLIHAGWWSAAHVLAPIVGLIVAGSNRRAADAAQTGARSTSFSDSAAGLVDFMLPLFLLTLASGVLLVWLMRISEVRRK